MEAEDRGTQADELCIPKAELDNLSNFFLECVFQQRKALRQKLIKMKESEESTAESEENSKLLDTYLNIVRTGSPEHIERFSRIERQKLVELLCTN